MPSARSLIDGVAAALRARFARRRSRRRRPVEELPAADHEIAADEVRELREELRRELARLAGADIKASRTRSESELPPG